MQNNGLRGSVLAFLSALNALASLLMRRFHPYRVMGKRMQYATRSSLLIKQCTPKISQAANFSILLGSLNLTKIRSTCIIYLSKCMYIMRTYINTGLSCSM